MKLATGTRLGPYEIEHAIGAGGMGVVYRADDSRVGRKVAIKILPNARGEGFRRFEREARTIGGLNHPNLLTLYDVGEHNGVPFLVTEMLEGQSLRARLSEGKLRVREAIQIAADVARGLAAAHDAGVIHRDVKPDNIFLTASGRTKILDFGIAKLRRSTVEIPAVDPVADTPNPTTRDTGVVVGTPGYMAPEQLDAGQVDERSDIFALGVVLYEMICGRRAFASESPVEESYAILKTTPDPPKGATKSLARVVMRCLEKKKDARFQSAGDLAFALDELDASTDPISRISKVAIETEPLGVPTVRDRVPMQMPRRWKWVALGLLGAIACGLGGVLLGKHSIDTRGMLRASWPSVVEGGPVYQRVTYHTQSEWNARLTPDGKALLYSVPRNGRLEIVRSAIGQPSLAPTNITGRLLDVSRRGEIAVVTIEVPGAGGTLSRAFEGTGLRPVADRVTDATFVGDDALAVIRADLVVESPVGKAIVTRAAGKLDHLRASPSGDRLAFAEHPASGDLGGSLVVVDLTGKELQRIDGLGDIEGIAWTPDGGEVWFTNDTEIHAIATGGAQRTVLRVATRLRLVDYQQNRLLVAPSDLRLKMFTGKLGGPYHEVGLYDSSDVESVTADGSAIAFVEASGTGSSPDGTGPTYVRHADTPATQIGRGWRSALLPDGSALITVSSATTLERIPTGVGAPTPIALGKIAEIDISDRLAVSWNGRYVVVRGAEKGEKSGLWRIDLQAPGSVEPIAASFVNGRHPISNDGEVVAIARATGGVALVTRVPNGGAAAHEIAGPVGESPLSFTGDGKALFVMHLDGDTLAIDRIDLADDSRTSWGRITPEQTPVYYSVALDADGGVVTYSTNSDSSDLYVLEKPPAQ